MVGLTLFFFVPYVCFFCMQLSLSVQQKFESHDCQTRMFADTDEQNDVGKHIKKQFTGRRTIYFHTYSSSNL